ncbi:MAG: hypothetical protein L6V95_15445 [Candidatus Melainabacteria bacterium]|nr:MAG: hypothetical protein L6V95_15445 [Candidatus Melainabacteria bacterium]
MQETKRCTKTHRRTFGENTYTIIKPKDKDGKEIEAKPLGVGSVAETWLVKDKADKEYVVKMVKPGISKETIEKQKQQCWRCYQQKIQQKKKLKQKL